MSERTTSEQPKGERNKYDRPYLSTDLTGEKPLSVEDFYRRYRPDSNEASDRTLMPTEIPSSVWSEEIGKLLPATVADPEAGLRIKDVQRLLAELRGSLGFGVGDMVELNAVPFVVSLNDAKSPKDGHQEAYLNSSSLGNEAAIYLGDPEAFVQEGVAGEFNGFFVGTEPGVSAKESQPIVYVVMKNPQIITDIGEALEGELPNHILVPMTLSGQELTDSQYQQSQFTLAA